MLMNKLGFCSGLLSIIICFFQSIPLGIYFDSGVSSYASISLNLFSSNNFDFFLWGKIDQSTLVGHSWLEANLISFFMLYIFTLIAGIITIIGSTIEKISGKAIISLNSLLLLIVIIYISIFIPLNSIELIDTAVDFMELFTSLGSGYFLLIIDFILALFSIRVHPLEIE